MIIKDTFYTLAPLNWCLRSVALSHITRKKSQLQVFGSMIKSAIYIIGFTFLNIFFLQQKMNKEQNNISDGILKFTSVIQMTYWFGYLIYIIDLYFVCRYGGEPLLKYIKSFDYIDKSLGRSDYDGIRRMVIKNTIFVIGSYLFICLFDYITWIFIEGWRNPTLYAIDYIYLYLNMLTILDIVTQIVNVEYRLKVIQDLLENNSAFTYVRPVTNDIHGGTSRKGSLSLYSLNILRVIRDLETPWFTKSYLLLLEQVTFLNTAYGFRAMVHSMNLLFNMTNLLNLSVRSVKGNIIEIDTDVILSSSSILYTFLPIASSLLRALNYEILAIVLLYRCEQAYKQHDKILETVDILLPSARHRSDLKSDLLEFRNLLITRPIRFHAAKFFTMDFTFLVSLNSVVVTYSIIMLQNMQ